MKFNFILSLNYVLKYQHVNEHFKNKMYMFQFLNIKFIHLKIVYYKQG